MPPKKYKKKYNYWPRWKTYWQGYILWKYYGKGGGGQLGEKIKFGVREKNEKRERKKEENYIKKGKKALKMHLFGL